MSLLYLFVGDLHRNMDAAATVIAIAAQHRATLIQVGDWGFLFGSKVQRSSTDMWLEIEGGKRGARWHDSTVELSALLVAASVHMRFIDGNHDVQPILFEYPPGDYNVAPNLTYQPRGSLYVDADGTRFVFMGGAPSIDRHMRVEGQSWWPTEFITDDDVTKAIAHGKADVLVTHDAPDVPPGVDLSRDGNFASISAASRTRVRCVQEALRPDLHVHGHWHRRYTRRDGQTLVIGLDRDGRPMTDLCYLWSAGE